jgi:GntR family transcriptional regulator/MocR family aminotransferase
VFVAFAAHGDLARHLRRLRRELSQRRAAVAAAVREAGHVVEGDAAGAHVVVPLPDAAAERAVIDAAAARGVTLDGLARHHAGDPGRAGIVLGYAEPPRSVLERGLAVAGEVLALLNANR